MDAQRIKDFLLERELGSGGMATVWLARQDGTGRAAAVKLMHPHLAKDASFIQRFVQEVRAASAMRHPNIVELIACGEEGGRYFMASELVDGGSVEELMARGKPLPAPVAALIASQALAGLSFAHARGVIHRDVKPANLLLTKAGALKVADFGIAKVQGGAALTQTGVLIGTPAYMSPEQAAGKPLDPRSDLFSAGVVFCEMATGVNPYDAENESAALLRVLTVDPPSPFEIDPSLPPVLEAALARMLERDPARRFPSAEAAVEALAGYVQEVNARMPGLAAAYLEDPEGMKKRLDGDLASAYLARARERLARGPHGAVPAAIDLYRALRLAPDDAEAQALYGELCAQTRLYFGPPRNPRIPELVSKLEREPPTVALLNQLASLYKLDGNLYRVAACYKRILKLRPQDTYTAAQLGVLLGDIVPAPTDLREAPAAPPPPVAEPRQPAAPAVSPAVATPAAPAPVPSAEVPGLRTPTHAVRKPTPAQRAPSQLARWLAVGAPIGLVVLLAVVAAVRMGAGPPSEEVPRPGPAEAPLAGMRPAPQAPVAPLAEPPDEATLVADAAKALEKGRAMFAEKRYQEADAALAALMRAHPKRPEAATAAFLRGRLLTESGYGNLAIPILLTACSEHATSPEAVEGRAVLVDAFVGAGRAAEAVEAATQFLSANPRSALCPRVRLGRAQARLMERRLLECRSDLEAALADLKPGDPLRAKALELKEKLAAAERNSLLDTGRDDLVAPPQQQEEEEKPAPRRRYRFIDDSSSMRTYP